MVQIVMASNADDNAADAPETSASGSQAKKCDSLVGL